MEENKLITFTVLGVVSVVAVLSVVLLLTDTSNTGYSINIQALAQKVYVNAEGDPTPQFTGRLNNGLAGTDQSQTWETQTPYRDAARSPVNIPSLMTACNPSCENPVDYDLVPQYARYGAECRQLNGGMDGRWCCQKVSMATQQVRPC